MVKVVFQSLGNKPGLSADESSGHYRKVKEFVRLYSEAEERCRRAFQRNDEQGALQAIREMKVLESRIAFRVVTA